MKKDLKMRRVRVLSEAAKAGMSIRNAHINFAKFKAKMTKLALGLAVSP